MTKKCAKCLFNVIEEGNYSFKLNKCLDKNRAQFSIKYTNKRIVEKHALLKCNL